MEEKKKILGSEEVGFIKMLTSKSRLLNIKAISKSNSNKIISVDFDNTKAIKENCFIKSVAIDYEKRILKYNLYCSACYELIGKSLKMDFKSIYHEIVNKEDYALLCAFNLFVGEYLKENSNDILKLMD